MFETSMLLGAVLAVFLLFAILLISFHHRTRRRTAPRGRDGPVWTGADTHSHGPADASCDSGASDGGCGGDGGGGGGGD